jgi:hypothetical protein
MVKAQARAFRWRRMLDEGELLPHVLHDHPLGEWPHHNGGAARRHPPSRILPVLRRRESALLLILPDLHAKSGG